MDLGSLLHVLHAVGTDGTVVAQVYLLAGGEERRIQVGLVWIYVQKNPAKIFTGFCCKV